MAGLPRAPSKRKYSWWWDSHISPKNSKWLEENLTDMDAKVKAMIKLIEEDADSFARRAEMYYKKRPELMKLVEEFYRAYRALAERYDNATGVLRQAHRTMTEAFPNHVALGMNDDSPENASSEMGPQTPDIPPSLHALVRKSLNFDEREGSSESEAVSNFEKEIQALKDAIAKLEAEKEVGLSQYEKSLEELKKLESEVLHAQEESTELNERANKAEGEVQDLRVSLTKLEAEKEASLLEYQKCVEKIDNLENNVSQAKGEVGELNERLHKAESEKHEALDRYNQSLEKISNFENKLKLTEEVAREISERTDNAGKEIETLKLAIIKLTEENESTALRYQQCLEKISILENKLSCAEEEVQRLKGEVDSGVTKLKGTEEQCLAFEKLNESLNSEIGSLVLKMGSQSEELTEKQQELGELWTTLQEERFRFAEAETAFLTLQNLHSQTQEQLRSLALEIDNKGQLLKDIETRNETLLDEKMRITEENTSLNGLNLSSTMTIKEMQNEIYCLKEDLNKSNKQKQIIESSVKQLQIENSDLKETYENEKAEKMLFLEKLMVMEQLVEKNALLEKLLSDLTSELEGARGKINALEKSFETLLEEKSAILAEKAAVMSQLQATIENLEKISEKNNCLENSLSSACDELNVLKARSKNLEEEKIYLINEKSTLVSQGQTTQQGLEALERRQRDLEEKYSSLEKERESTYSKLEELRNSLDVEKNEHSNFAQRTETQLAGMGKQIYLLQEEVFSRRREFEEELDKAMNYQLEIFIFGRCVEDLKEKNSSLLAECHKLVEGSKLSEKLICDLKCDNIEKEVEVKSLSDQTSMLLKKFEDTKNSLDQALDENQRLRFEMSIIVMLLGQLSVEAKALDLERDEQLILSNSEASGLLELNGDLNLKVSQLTSVIAGLKREIDEVNVVSNGRESQVHKLSADNVVLSKKNLSLQKENKELEAKLELMTQQWESEASTMFGEMQYSNIVRAFLEEKFYELEDGLTSKDAQIELLGKRIAALEGKNGGLGDELVAYSRLIMPLKDSISSLESRTLRTKLKKSHKEGVKENGNLDMYSELKDLNYRVKVIEKAVVQKERLVAQDSFDTNTKLEAAMKSIDDLKFRQSLNREYSVPVSDNSEFENEISMKDIVLDVNSESSPCELNRQSGRKYPSKMVESWDSADLDRCIDLAFGKDKMVKSPPNEILKRQKSKRQNLEIADEKELGVDKLAISRTFSQRNQEANKIKILERLNSDAQKLTNLQITVQDLMKKIEITERGRKGKAVYEHNTLREQLEEAEEAIIELLDCNGKLIRSVEKRSFSSNVKLGVDSEESGSARRRRISENARKMSEKIGRLQLEVQKIQFVLVKIDDENAKESKGKAKFMEMRRRVLLRDYLYGVARGPSHQTGKKKSGLCGCIQPPTQGD